MVYIKIFIITIVYVCYVKSSDVNVNSNRKTENITRNSRTYSYNHPPAAEINTPIAIPVNVVYDEKNRDHKSIKVDELTTSTVNNENESNTDSSKTKSSNQHEEPITLKGSFKVAQEEDNKTKENKRNQISPSEIELQIPVAVVYDQQPDLVNQEKISLSKKSKPNPRNQRKMTNNLVASRANVQNENFGESKIQPRSIVANKTNARTKFSKRVRERAPVVPIIQSENYVYSHSGNFHYSYEGGDGTKAYESGQMSSLAKNAGTSVVGSFSYIGKDGNDYGLNYTADENGYRPVGAHLPTPPPIPPAIARALLYLATKTTPEPVTEATKRKHQI